MQDDEPIIAAVEDVAGDFLRYLALVREGATVQVSSEGKIVAELVRPRRRPGSLKGRIKMSDDFDTWPEDILASFEASLDSEPGPEPDKS